MYDLNQPKPLKTMSLDELIEYKNALKWKLQDVEDALKSLVLDIFYSLPKDEQAKLINTQAVVRLVRRKEAGVGKEVKVVNEF